MLLLASLEYKTIEIFRVLRGLDYKRSRPSRTTLDVASGVSLDFNIYHLISKDCIIVNRIVLSLINS